MVDALLRGDHAQTGVRPFDPYRDLKPVAQLIAAAFNDRLGPDGDLALAQMQRLARWGPLLSWLGWPGLRGKGMAPGFVWVQDGRAVGNVSLRRAAEWGGFFIGNVAVHPDWQGQGIASALMKAALEAVSARGGRWVGLEVQVDNHIARRLYEHMGFREVGRTWHMLRPAGLPWVGHSPSWPTLRRGLGRDSAGLIKLVEALVPAPHRPLLELRKADYRLGWERTLDCWLEGRREVWWVIEEDDVLYGAVRALRERGRRLDRLEVLVSPGHGDHLESILVQRGIASLRGAPKTMVETILPSPTEPLVAALEAANFHRLRLLVQMRLDLARRIPVRG